MPNRSRGDSPPASRRPSSSSFSFLFSLDGTSTSTVTNRSPFPPFDFGAPLPRRRNVFPDGVPAGTFSVTGPFIVGTFTLAPSAASANVTGTVNVRSAPLRANNLCSATWTTTNRSPDGAPAGPGSPRPPSRMRAPSRTPGGIFTENFRVRRTLPEPWQVGQGVSTIRPDPAQLGHGLENENGP